MIFLSIIIPILFKYGVEKGRLFIVVIAVIPSLLVALLGSTLKPPVPSCPAQNSCRQFCIPSPLFTLAIFLISFRISVGICRKKNIKKSLFFFEVSCSSIAGWLSPLFVLLNRNPFGKNVFPSVFGRIRPKQSPLKMGRTFSMKFYFFRSVFPARLATVFDWGCLAVHRSSRSSSFGTGTCFFLQPIPHKLAKQRINHRADRHAQ